MHVPQALWWTIFMNRDVDLHGDWSFCFLGSPPTTPTPTTPASLSPLPSLESHGLSNPSFPGLLHPHLSLMLSLQLFCFMNLYSFFKAQMKLFFSTMPFMISSRINHCLTWVTKILRAHLCYISHTVFCLVMYISVLPQGCVRTVSCL